MKIAILGAECTGKSTLAQALLPELQKLHPAVVSVAEYLRTWCDAHGRTPRADEQAHIARTQLEHMLAPPDSALVLCDTTPLMTAIYSDVLFGDSSLYAQALDQQRGCACTLVTGLDLPWVADGLQRDGAVMRAQVNERLRAVLLQHGMAFSTVYGQGRLRTANALQAIAHALGMPVGGNTPIGARGLWKWSCDKCSDPECEHRLFSDLVHPG